MRAPVIASAWYGETNDLTYGIDCTEEFSAYFESVKKNHEKERYV